MQSKVHPSWFRSRVLRGSCLTASALAVLTLFLYTGVPNSRAESGEIQQARSLQEVFVRIAESVTPSVVLIRTEGTIQHPLINQPPGAPSPPSEEIPRRGYGSGIIFDPRGYILTNHHVIEGSERVLVTLADEREFTGELVGSDPRTDLAVVRIRSDRPLRAARLGASQRLRIGQWAIAIGHPYGLERSVTVGVVSGTGRRGIGITHYENFIQTDASIHPGNSGGPLVNLDGEVIGVNTAIVSRTRGGIAFAIPIDMAAEIARKLMRDGRVVRGFLGVMIQGVSREMAPKFGLEKAGGALIADVLEGGASAKAGLRRGDIVLEFNGNRVRDVSDLQRLAAAAPPGSVVRMGIQRRGARIILPLVMEALREEAALPKPKSSTHKPSYGLTVGELTASLSKALADRDLGGGVQVKTISPNSRAALDGLLVGDVIREVEHRPVSGEASFQKAIESAPQNVLVFIYRAGRSVFRILHDPR
ncbi:MAG: trypsin-like peptidase domain-containing protein [Nitrospinota bacterium]